MTNLIHLFQCQSLFLFFYFHRFLIKYFYFLSEIEHSLFYCVRSCRPYFSVTATQEILDQFRPYLCPFDSAFSDTMRIFELFLPVHLPPELHDQGFKYKLNKDCYINESIFFIYRLWLPEFMGIWESVYSNPGWESVRLDLLKTYLNEYLLEYDKSIFINGMV